MGAEVHEFMRACPYALLLSRRDLYGNVAEWGGGDDGGGLPTWLEAKVVVMMSANNGSSTRTRYC
jgi:hypothetical protein